MTTPTTYVATGTRAIRPLPINELIAVGALLALAAWGLIVWSGRGGEPVALGPFDPGRWFPGRSLTLADLPLVVMLVAGGVPLVWDLLAKLCAGTFGSDLLAGLSIGTGMSAITPKLAVSRAVSFSGTRKKVLRMPAGAKRRRSSSVARLVPPETRSSTMPRMS